MASWRVPQVWWPSLMLISAVPAWCFVDGWNGGQGHQREPIAAATVAGENFRIWRHVAAEQVTTWCAQPLGAKAKIRRLAFRFHASTRIAEFDGGLYCASFEHGETDMPLLIAGGG